MHFEFSISIGQIIVFLTLMGAIWRFDRLLTLFAIEHEILIEDYVERKSKEKPDFRMPTRGKTVAGWWRR